MRVSWIDADQLNALVAQIAPQESGVDAEPASVEIATVADLVSGTGVEDWGAAMRWLEPEEEASPAVEVIPAKTAEPPPPAMVLEPEADDEDVVEEDDHGRLLHNPAAALPLSRIRDKLRAIRQRATDAGILTRVSDVPGKEPAEEIDSAAAETAAVLEPSAPEPPSDSETADVSETRAEQEVVTGAPSTPSFVIPHGSRDERLAAFAGWARQVLHEDGGHVLVLSDDGEVLWGGDVKAGLVLSTMMAWGSAIRASATAACETPSVIRQPLASGNVLTVIPCETSCGVIHAAVAAPVGLDEGLALALRSALCAAMNIS